MSKPENVRLYAILARESDRAVVFRRGPSKQVLLVAWNTATDSFEEGQWLKGRIYERRCDLSPDGALLIYFAASHRKPFYSWTAVSRPPYLTALALWPKGDAWGGGGHFASRRHILLNHRRNEMELADGFRLPKWMKVSSFGSRPGWGEDDPIWADRLTRDGWFRAKRAVWEKPNPRWPERYTLLMAIAGIHERDNAWYRTEHAVIDSVSDEMFDIGISDWADWSRKGDLLVARKGQLLRYESDSNGVSFLTEPRLLADFADRTFTERVAPPEATRWPRK